tara:strand:- start:112 stop:822 length:711 start_codon:yes stop_codon:yes gene_type:complete
MKVLAVIPARGGSKRIPLKNIKNFLGKPLIYHTIKIAKQSKIFDKIVVSTDSEKIKKIAKDCGAEVPFKRPAKISGDVPTEDVTIHAVKHYIKKNSFFDVVFTLEPTYVARKSHHLKTALNILKLKKNFDSVLTVTEIAERPEWMWRIIGNKMKPFQKTFKSLGKNIMKFPSSKIFKKLYIGNSIVFACRTNALLKYKSCIGINCYPMKISKKYDLDLNWPEDWKRCEIALKKIKT